MLIGIRLMVWAGIINVSFPKPCLHGCAAQLHLSIVPTRHVKFGPTDPALGPKPGPAGLLRGMNAMLRGSCRAQNEQPNAKRMHRRLDAGL